MAQDQLLPSEFLSNHRQMQSDTLESVKHTSMQMWAQKLEQQI